MAEVPKKDEITLGVSAADSVLVGDYANKFSITDSLRAVNTASSALDTTVISADFANRYNSIISLQQKALSSALEVTTRLNANSDHITELVSRTFAPTSSVMADIGRATSRISELVQGGNILEDRLQVSRNVLELSLGAIERQQSAMESIVNNRQLMNTLDALASSPILASSSMIGIGVDSILRSVPTYSIDAAETTAELKVVQEAAEVSDEELSEHQAKLDSLLRDIDPALVEFRRGAWETLRAKGKDHIGQAASSMRRMVDELLRAIASKEDAAKTEYFKNNPEAKDPKGDPTRKARLLYVMRYDEKKIAFLEQLVTDFLNAHGLLSAWDHKPTQDHDRVYGMMIVIEGHVLTILSEKK